MVTLPCLWDRMMDPQFGGIRDSFQLFSGKRKGEYVVSYWHEELVHKWIEAGSYQLAREYDAELDRQIDEAIKIIADAQEADGYVVASSVLYDTFVPKRER